jgi:hypothetical protein
LLPLFCIVIRFFICRKLADIFAALLLAIGNSEPEPPQRPNCFSAVLTAPVYQLKSVYLFVLVPVYAKPPRPKVTFWRDVLRVSFIYLNR